MNNQKNQNKYCVIVVVAAHQNIVKGHWRLLARDRAVGRLGEKLDFLAPGDVKLIATLITKPTNLSHIQSELQSDTLTIRIRFIVKETA